MSVELVLLSVEHLEGNLAGPTWLEDVDVPATGALVVAEVDVFPPTGELAMTPQVDHQLGTAFRTLHIRVGHLFSISI